MNPNLKFSETHGILGAIAPVSAAVGTLTTGWVSFDRFMALCAVLKTGVLGASATVDCKFQQATDAAGTGAKDVTGKALTQIVKATGDGKQYTLQVSPGDLDTVGGFGFVRASVTVGVAASLIDLTLLGLSPIYAPASNFDASTVAQQV